MIKATGINKSYGALEVLKGVSLEIKKGEIISIVGASGAGKTTLLHILGTLDRPNTGSLSINNENISDLSDKKLAEFRNKNIGFVFQFLIERCVVGADVRAVGDPTTIENELGWRIDFDGVGEDYRQVS